MKLIHIVCASVAASFLPTATAFEPQGSTQESGKDARRYAIAVTSHATPVSHQGMRYPNRAATRGISGSCDVRVDVDAAGRASDVQLMSCTSDVFSREAVKLASGLAFKAGAPNEDAVLQIRWTIAREQAGIRTASLD